MLGQHPWGSAFRPCSYPLSQGCPFRRSLPAPLQPVGTAQAPWSRSQLSPCWLQGAGHAALNWQVPVEASCPPCPGSAPAQRRKRLSYPSDAGCKLGWPHKALRACHAAEPVTHSGVSHPASTTCSLLAHQHIAGVQQGGGSWTATSGQRCTWTKCATEGNPFCCASKMAMPVGFMPRRVMQMDELQIQPCTCKRYPFVPISVPTSRCIYEAAADVIFLNSTSRVWGHGNRVARLSNSRAAL